MYLGLRYAHTKKFACKILFWKMYKTRFAAERKNKKKILLSLSKKASHTISIHGIYMITVFLTKSVSFLFSTIHQLCCQNKKKVLWKNDENLFANCMKLVWLVFLHRLSLWNCKISIFGLWRSTRMEYAYIFEHVYRLVSGFQRSIDTKLCAYPRHSLAS